MAEGRVDGIISTIMAVRASPPGTKAALTESDVGFLLRSVRDILAAQPTVLDLPAPITIVGDIHGQFHDMMQIFDICGYPPDVTYLFLGDYVDRGRNSIECICMLFAYKVKYADKVFLLRGNHEVSAVNAVYGFRDDVVGSFSPVLYHQFGETFDYLPIAALVAQKVLCIHDGLSPELHSLAQLRDAKRPLEIAEGGLLWDCVWADPRPRADKRFKKNERGTSFIFSGRAAREFLQAHDLSLLARAHQVVPNGYEWPFRPERTVVTVYSCPNYTGPGKNRAAVMTLDRDARPTFVQLPVPTLRSEGRRASSPSTEGARQRVAALKW
jgi:serine/threonine-protein phosphatase PP1 catalytic subunit